MKVSREKAEENRERVIDTAATLLRERGIDGIGIVDLMNAAGLTHGGFYRQFQSKDDLVVQAVKRAHRDTREDIRARMEAAGNDPLEALVRHYVSPHHRDAPAQGCCLTALAADAARRDDPALRSLFGEIAGNYVALLAGLVPGSDPAEKRPAAIAFLAEMIGAVILSRVVPDPSLSSEIIAAVSDDLLKRHPPAVSA